KVVFHDDENEKKLYLFLSDFPPIAAVRLPWYETAKAQWGLLGGSAAIFLTGLLFWPVIGFSVRGLKSPYIRRTQFSGFLSFVAWLLCGACIGFAIALVVVMQEPTEIAFGMPPALKKLLAVPQVCAVLAGITVLGCLIAWAKSFWRFTGRLHYTLVALAGV